MADKTNIRQRARYTGERSEIGSTVTILDGSTKGRRGMTTIRSAYGYVLDVPTKDLEPLDTSEPEASFRYTPSPD